MTQALDAKNLEVRMDTSKKRFYFPEVKAEDAELTYKVDENGIMEFTSTYVPESLREIGLGERLVVEAYQHLIDNEKKAKISCDFMYGILHNRRDFGQYIIQEESGVKE